MVFSISSLQRNFLLSVSETGLIKGLRKDVERNMCARMTEPPSKARQIYPRRKNLAKFDLPIHITSSDEYDKTVKDEFEKYKEETNVSMSLTNDKKFIDELESIMDGILTAISAERIGDTEDARNKIKKIITKYIYDPFFISELDCSYAFRGAAPFDVLRDPGTNYDQQAEYPLSFYRCRRNKVENVGGMLNIPISERSKCRTNRFSLPGIPCLYLSTTTFCCWKEIDTPCSFSAIGLSPNHSGKKLRVLNLAISQNLINGVESDSSAFMQDLGKKMRLLFPLVIATSIAADNADKCAYVSEYTISHLIMRCLKELYIDGVAYFSTKLQSNHSFPSGVNLAIPVFSESTNDGYGETCHCFDTTEPIYIDLDKPEQTSLFSEKHSYINQVFSKEYNQVLELPEIEKNFPFPLLDDHLASATYRPTTVLLSKKQLV